VLSSSERNDVHSPGEATTLTKKRFAPGIIAVLALMLILTAITPALASKITDKQAEAKAIQAQIDALNTRVEIAAEAYNAAGVRLDGINKDVAKNSARLRVLQRRLGKLDTRLDTRATSMYKEGPLGFLEVLVGSQTFDQFSSNWDLMTSMSQDDASMLKEVRSIRAQATATRGVLKSKQAQARAQVRIRRAQRIAIAQQLSKRKTVLASVKSDITRLIAEEAARQAAAAAAAARAEARRLARSGSSGGGGGGDYNYPAPSIPAHGNVVTYAMSRIGCPYVWGGSGPGVFDCSGLTSWAYAQIGISIPHSSQAQINCGQRVSKANLQPGDLVFFGSPIHHVGMYIGGGQMVEAPYTGASVRTRSAFRSDYAGACRP
jgi:cell wall-associated NlpC family hydrolase